MHETCLIIIHDPGMRLGLEVKFYPYKKKGGGGDGKGFSHAERGTAQVLGTHYTHEDNIDRVRIVDPYMHEVNICPRVCRVLLNWTSCI